MASAEWEVTPGFALAARAGSGGGIATSATRRPYSRWGVLHSRILPVPANTSRAFAESWLHLGLHLGLCSVDRPSCCCLVAELKQRACRCRYVAASPTFYKVTAKVNERRLYLCRSSSNSYRRFNSSSCRSSF